MSREVVIKLGLDGAFATRRWEQPENVIRLTKELGFNFHEYCCDQIDLYHENIPLGFPGSYFSYLLWGST